jgi:hypothetical protein
VRVRVQIGGDGKDFPLQVAGARPGSPSGPEDFFPPWLAAEYSNLECS